MISSDFQQDFFSLFNLPRRFEIDQAELDRKYRELQAQVHPDKFAHLSDTERRLSVQWATRVNEAYQTLRSPLARGRYLLALQGVDTQEETNTAMPVEFLMQQMELREALEAALQSKDMAALDALEAQVKQTIQALQQQLALALDEQRDDAAAAGLVRKLKFMEKIAEEIAAAFDELDS
ncbi:Fe-S protein assembly co-chaperone HscB [Ferrigenium sp. UT5]|uniref:Fe-S protein assembly co-chaperone HscB n=1 Tax=Ferrigenium sp. UT5 TaxID=3242105 RepID=UPI00354C635B